MMTRKTNRVTYECIYKIDDNGFPFIIATFPAPNNSFISEFCSTEEITSTSKASMSNCSLWWSICNAMGWRKMGRRRTVVTTVQSKEAAQ